jgi:EAL domain-containing protein (putative c-di-GMP-specific phosphodiesterase class I)
VRKTDAVPADFPKIAKPFVDGLHDEKDAALVQTIVTLAHSLGMEPIAEGIEQRSQLERLRALGTAYGQGYLFARPQTAAEIDVLLEAAAAALAA